MATFEADRRKFDRRQQNVPITFRDRRSGQRRQTPRQALLWVQQRGGLRA